MLLDLTQNDYDHLRDVVVEYLNHQGKQPAGPAINSFNDEVRRIAREKFSINSWEVDNIDANTTF